MAEEQESDAEHARDAKRKLWQPWYSLLLGVILLVVAAAHHTGAIDYSDPSNSGILGTIGHWLRTLLGKNGMTAAFALLGILSIGCWLKYVGRYFEGRGRKHGGRDAGSG